MSFRRWACALVSVCIVVLPGLARASWWGLVPFQPDIFVYRCHPTNPKYSKYKTKFILDYSFVGSFVNFSDERGLMPKTIVPYWDARELTQAQSSALNLPPGRYLNFDLVKQDSSGPMEVSIHYISASILRAPKTVTMGSGFVIANRPLGQLPAPASLIWKCSR